MAWKYYANEEEKYGAVFDLRVTGQEEAKKIIKKLIRHFKLPPIGGVEFTKRKNGGTYWRRSRYISLHPSDIRIGVVCHELAHHWDYMENRRKQYDKKFTKTHTKKHARYTQRLMKYCAKMNYWGWIKQKGYGEVNQ